MAYEQVWNFPGKRFNLTVSERPEEAAAVFAEDGDSIQREEGSEQKCYRITKIVVSFLTVIAVLFCVVASKISAIAVAQSLGDHVNGTFLDVDEVATPLTFFYKPYAGDTSNHTAGAGELPEYQQVTIFMLVLLLGIPYVFSLARCIWVGGFSCGCDKNSSKPWPSVGAILVGFVSSVFEVTGLWLVVLLLFPWMSAFTALAVSTTVFIWPNIWATVEPFLLRLSCFRYDKIDKMEDSGSSDAAFGVGCSSKAETVVNMVFVVLNILGLCLLAVFQQIDMEAHYRASDAWLLPIVCFLLTFAWWPWMLKRQLIKSGVHGGNGESDRFGHQKPDKLVRWKAGILSNFWKLVLTFTLPMLFSYVRYGNYSYFTFLTRPVWYVHLRLLTHPAFGYFLLNILTSFGGYIFTWFADSINAGFDVKKTVAGRFNIKTYLSIFFIPLSLATPIAAFVVGEVNTCSLLPHFHCDSLTGHQAAIGVLAIVILFIVNFFSIGRFILNNKTLVLAKESQLFWLSSYNGVMLEQWLWLNRKTYRTDTTKRNPDHLRKEATIYINTTMYNESAEEMGQLLQSLRRVRDDRHANSPAYYSHIWLDGAFDTKKKGDVFNTNTLRLLSLLQDIFDVSFAPGDKGFEKVRTKYGMRLTWKFPLNSTEALEDPERYTMSLNLHLKDNRKVKNKKRWSQIMYLSLVLDYLNQKPREGATAEELKQWEQRLQNSYILATDADVKFTLPSVEALLEIYLRDDSLRIGAVCGRTHPLGSQVQPVVSYQVFDYAVGHWFQKVFYLKNLRSL
ncbi:uncharacterized protein LOC106151889 isoform X1 [Lingula anatina]|uniref:Uncharacterized protein LOC106151889 isoform X1 n=2 Tax=Lingula anatina TaxID=7574 RepID=A0A1S3H3R5_LINAN|nr:uncharacterized protein LOC106151889 isoform X1 [Lingula anatina]|eukprot:XP_013380780.1 uncharacterized protein LOC106151889 isoform X1 [Lingula anatina]